MIAAPAAAAFGMTAAFSWLAERRLQRYGRSPSAHVRYGVALGTCVLVVAVTAFTGAKTSWAGAAILACASVCAATDVHTGYIFDWVLLATAACILPAMVLSGNAADALLGAVACGGALLIPYTVSRGRAIGFGDVKLAGTAGLALGLIPSLAALWIACVAGGLVATLGLVTGRARRDTAMRFGPFQAFGICAVLIAASR
jgi:leader peptidase (prepilin peptidase)/N-methyltransferase